MTARSNKPGVQVATRIPQALAQRLRLLAVRRDVTMMELIETTLREKLTRERGKRG